MSKFNETIDKVEKELGEMVEKVEKPLSSIIEFVKAHKRLVISVAVVYFLYNYLTDEK